MVEAGDELTLGRERAADSICFARSRIWLEGISEPRHNPSYIKPIQLFREASLVRESRVILSAFQLRLSGGTPAGDLGGAGFEAGIGERVPLRLEAVGVAVPLDPPFASFCWLTV